MPKLRRKIGTSVSLTMVISCISFQSSRGSSAPLVDIDPSTQYSFNEQHVDGMVGYTFYLHQAITVTQVGWYDDGQDGLSRAFRVGLWEDLSGASEWPYINPQNAVQLLGVGNPRTGITIPGGTSASLNGVWRVVSLASPLSLQPGGYELAGLDTATTPDPIRYVFGGPSNPQLTIGAPVLDLFAQPSGFHVSDSFILVDGLELGPMLFWSVPEPSTLAVGSLSIAALILFRWKK